jgi:hypothetical protein
MPTEVMPRLANLALKPSRQQFAFAISFKPRSACTDWEEAQANLRRTIRSARAAAASSETAILAVACHDEPELGETSEAVHVLRVPFADPADRWQGIQDMARKRRFIGAWLRRMLPRAEPYVMFLDADDLVHKDIVEYVVAQGNGSYVVDQGYVLDLATGLLWHRRKGFQLTCGSSFVCRFARDELPSSWEDAASPFGQFGSLPDQRGHTNYDQVAAELGRPPAPVPFPAVVYTVNHSESLWAAKSGGRRSISSPRDVIWPREARRILAQDFSAPDLAQRSAELGRVSGAFTRAASDRVWARARSRASRMRRHRRG